MSETEQKKTSLWEQAHAARAEAGDLLERAAALNEEADDLEARARIDEGSQSADQRKADSIQEQTRVDASEEHVREAAKHQ